MHFIVYKDADGFWRWRLIARNGRQIAEGGEGYRRRVDCVKMCHRINVTFPVQVI